MSDSSSSESEGAGDRSSHSSSYHGDSDGDGSGVGVSLDEVNVSIQDVIRDRKVERKLQAEEKRQVDLQRIRDMRSTTGIDPLEQFPQEIWSKIFDELDPEDRTNVWHIHPLFRDLLQNTRLGDLLPQVLLKVCGRLKKKHRCISKTTRDYYDRWMADLRLGNILFKRAESTINDDSIVDTCLTDVREESEDPKLKQLLSSYVSGNGKRFFERAITVSFEEWEIEEGDDVQQLLNQYKSDVTALLEKVGDQIWQFRFFVDISSVPFDFTDVYLLIQGYASLMPNLKWLEVSLYEPSFQVIDGTDKNAQSAIRNNPFPHLVHLERLTFHTSYQPGKAKKGQKGKSFLNIYEIILGANHHIKMLDLTDGDKFSDDDYPLFPASLVLPLQLTRFTVCDEEYTQSLSMSCLSRIQPIVDFNWPLKTISLSLFSDPEGESIISVLEFLQKFPTLENVTLIRLEEFIIGNMDQFGYLQLPNLKNFDVELIAPQIDYNSNVHFFFSLQFLLECKKLEKISWRLAGFKYLKLREHLRRCERKMKGKMLDFRAGLRYLYDSNIWNVFPALDAVKVDIRRGKFALRNGDRDEYNFDERCEHKYMRKDIESMTIRRFLNEHKCSRDSGDRLGSCVMLVK